MNPNYPQGGAIPLPNPSYPMARLNGSAYAAPLNYNQPSEVVGGYDAKINPMTGEEIPQVNFAGGGRVKPEAGIASLLASRGRNGDSMLVHMAPNEVRGLQALALAHGGSLSINPDTGLVEANFLKKLLPTLLGFGLNFLIPGLGAIGSGLLVGGIETARTGDLSKGLMAGLGAYGGAGLGSSLAGAGAVAGGAGQAGITAAGEAAAKEAAAKGLETAAIEEAKKKAVEEATRKAIAEQAASKAATQGAAGWTNLKTGASNLFSSSPGIGALKGANAFGGTLGALTTPAKAGLVMSGAEALTPEMKIPSGATEIDKSYYESYGYDPEEGRFLGGQWRTGYPGFPGGMAAGGPVSFAAGGASFAKQEDDARTVEDYSTPKNFTYQDYARPSVDPGYFIPATRQSIPVGVPAFQQPTTPNVAATAPSLPPPPPAPQAPGGITSSLGDYMAQLNKFVTSPISAPKRTTPAPSPSAAPAPSGGLGGMKWDPAQGRFVDQSGGAPNINFGGIPFSGIGDLGMYGSQYGDINGYTPPEDQGNYSYTPPTAPPTAPSDMGGYNPFAGTNINFSGIGGAGSYMPPAPDTSYQPPAFDYTPEPSYTPPAYQAQEPIYQEPVYQPPAYQPPAYREQEPVYQQPVFDYTPAPSYTPPAYQAQEPIYQEPVYQPPVYQPPAYQAQEPIYQEPVYQPPAYQPPAYQAQEPIYQEPVFDYTPAPSYTPPAYQAQEPIYQEPVYQPPVYRAPEPVYEPPAYAQPTPESIPVVENIPQRPILSGDDGRAISRDMPPVEEFLGTPYMPEVPMTPVFNPPQYQAPEIYREPYYQPTYQPTYEPTYQPTYQPTYEPYGLGAIDSGFYDQMYAGGGTVQYAAAGKFLRGPGDGMSDDIKANISGKQEARLADGEFVVPADVVSHIGNGSSEAGSRKLYAMMDRIRKARTGRKEQAPEVKAEKYLPA